MGWKDIFRRKLSVSLEEQLENLSCAGIHLKPEFNVETLLESWNREEYEKSPYELLLYRLGGELEREPWTPLSDNAWHFDTECIEDNGDYIRIAERLRNLAEGALPLADVKDEIDVENGIARLSFTVDGKFHHWDLEVQDDWVDTTIFERFQQLLSGISDKRLAYHDTGGQDVLFVCRAPESLDQLSKITRMDFRSY
jgi:hypothetical protein